MTTAITKRSFNITTNDTFTLNTVTPDSDRKQTVDIMLTANAVVGGSVLLQARPRGSTKAFQTIAYTLLGTGATQATALSASSIIRVDATGLELALTSSGLTGGSWDVDVTDSPER